MKIKKKTLLSVTEGVNKCVCERESVVDETKPTLRERR